MLKPVAWDTLDMGHGFVEHGPKSILRACSPTSLAHFGSRSGYYITSRFRRLPSERRLASNGRSLGSCTVEYTYIIYMWSNYSD